MKKYLLFLTVIAVTYLNTSAQSFQLINQGTQIVNGTSLQVSGSSSTFDISKNLWVRNVSGQTLDVKVKRIEINVTPGTLNATCWDICPPSDTAGDAVELISSTTVNMADSAIDYSFSAHIYPERVSGCSHFRYIFFGVGTAFQDSVDIYFSHGQTCAPLSTNAIESSKISFDVYPNPSSDFVNIDLSQEINNGELIITNTIGSVVKRIRLDALNNKSLSISDLENGIYFISILNEEKQISTRKLQIAR
jgi:hypothetical protein